MRKWPIASSTAIFMAVPVLFAFSAMDGEVEDVEVVEVSDCEVAVIADGDEDVCDVVNTGEMTTDGGIGDCSPVANSTGSPAILSHVDSNDFACVQMPVGNWSQLVASPSAVDEYPFMSGNLCLNPFQMVKASQPMVTQAVMTPYQSELVDPGGTWYFQVMYRDPGFDFGANVSSMVAVTFPAN